MESYGRGMISFLHELDLSKQLSNPSTRPSNCMEKRKRKRKRKILNYEIYNNIKLWPKRPHFVQSNGKYEW